jgi:hypothetical protein
MPRGKLSTRRLPQVLHYSCGHLCDADTGLPLADQVAPDGVWVKDIHCDCPGCARQHEPVKRLPPGLAQRIAEEGW